MKTHSLLLVLAVIGTTPLGAQISPSINQLPTREFGHAKLNLGLLPSNPNLVEGKEFNSPVALAFDVSVSPPIVYVADSVNNRVLAWRNPGALTAGNQADRVIGQRDFFTTAQGGPGRVAPALSAAGMSLPTGLAVDTNGNLYVFDSGNNRILRFPKPLEQPGEFTVPDLVIGQKTAASGAAANQGLAKPTAKTLAVNAGGVQHGSLAFDAQGNLWVSDCSNNRVLRFPKENLTGSEPAADLVLGQPNFTSNDVATGGQTGLVGLRVPTGIAISPTGAVYVSDYNQRVVYYATPATGAQATRILGIQPAATLQQPRPPAPNDYTLGQKGTEGGISQCVFLSGEIPFICDNTANRIVRYAAPAQWPAATDDVPSPPIIDFYGQNTIFEGETNRGGGPTKPEVNTFSGPSAGAIFNGEMWIADTGNNRVLVLGESGSLQFPAGTRVLGQNFYNTNGTNLVEGRDLWVHISGDFRGSALAVDLKSTPNRLYVADSLNNRILAFADVRSVGTDSRSVLTQSADLVIGQGDMFHGIVNYPSGDPLVPGDQGLFTPAGVAVDADGNLWVADTGNGRLLRFPSPFAQPPGTVHRATVVLGQASFTFKINDPSSVTMANPVGVAVFGSGDVAASDLLHHRVLLFRKEGTDFVNGQAARAVLGQPNFSSTTPASSAASLYAPRGIAVDSSDRLYVADSANNRVIVYTNTANTPNGASGTVIPNLSSPEGVAVSPNSGEIWVAAYFGGRILRFREYSLLGVQASPTAELYAQGPMALALDPFDNVIAVESVNRMTFYYAQLVYRNAASYAWGKNLTATMTPGLYVFAARLGKNFVLTPGSAIPPYPTTMSGVQVSVNGVPAPITATTESLIYFLVPNNAPTSGDAEFVVSRPETGEILAAGSFTMGPAAPGFFTVNLSGSGQVAATLVNGTVNGPSNRVGLGERLILYLTGYGHLSNAPPDGTASGAAVFTDVKPVINVGGVTLPPEYIEYSGMNPVLPGLWQINLLLPKNGELPAVPAPGDRVPILLLMRDVPSNIGGTGTLGYDQLLTGNLLTTIAIK